MRSLHILTFLGLKGEQAGDPLALLQSEVEKLKASMNDLESILQRTDRSGRRQQQQQAVNPFDVSQNPSSSKDFDDLREKMRFNESKVNEHEQKLNLILKSHRSTPRMPETRNYHKTPSKTQDNLLLEKQASLLE